jgi:short-subunit dehydrogenase
MPEHTGELAVITGASTGIGYEFAKIAAGDGYDLVVVADEIEIEEAARKLGQHGTTVEAVRADLATEHGVSALWEAIKDRRVDVLFANAGLGLGGAFLDQDWGRIKHVIDTNVTGTTSLVHKVGRKMRDRGQGRIVLTGSVAGFIPGAFHAVYNGTKSFINSFAEALRNELTETAITVTCLEPGPTDTPFFERADMMDTSVGQDDSKEDPAKTARTGYDAMQSGDGQVVSGVMNKIQATFAGIIPDPVLAKMHRRMAEPGTGDTEGKPNTGGGKTR